MFYQFGGCNDPTADEVKEGRNFKILAPCWFNAWYIPLWFLFMGFGSHGTTLLSELFWDCDSTVILKILNFIIYCFILKIKIIILIY
jgi:hypothetical protein